MFTVELKNYTVILKMLVWQSTIGNLVHIKLYYCHNKV